MVLYFSGCDSEVKKSVKSDDVWEENAKKILLPWY